MYLPCDGARSLVVCTRRTQCDHEESMYAMDTLRSLDPVDSGVPLPGCTPQDIEGT